MHILILPSWYPLNEDDTVGMFFYEQAAALARLGHTVGVVAPRLESLKHLSWRSLSPNYRHTEIDDGVVTLRTRLWAWLPRVPYGNYWIWKRAANRLLREYLASQGVPDLIHAHCMVHAGVVAARWSRELGIPLVVTEHSSAFPRKLYSRFDMRLVREAIGTADALISVSPSLSRVMEEFFPDTKGHWRTVPNVVGDHFSDGDVVRGAQAGRRRVFVSIGSLEPNKGQAELLAAFARACQSGVDPGSELWIAGAGPSQAALIELARRLGLEGRVSFLGKISPGEVPALLGKADVLVVASRHETFGVVAAEALMSGIPVLSTRCGGPESILQEGDGLLVDSNEPDVLADGLLRIYGDLDAFDRVSISRRARERFSPEVVAGELTGVYEGVLGRG